jgi:hypothetical protein
MRAPPQREHEAPTRARPNSPFRGFHMGERVRVRPWQQGLNEEKELGQKWEARREYYADATTCRLKVVARVRPADARARVCVSCEERIGPWVSVNGGPNLEFTTAVLGPASSQRDVYVECAEPLMEAALGGQDSCLFAYGQTGAGKTHSMLGAEGGHCASKLDGVIPQLCSELFRSFSAQTKKGELEFQVSSRGSGLFYSCNPKQAVTGLGQPGGRAGV